MAERHAYSGIDDLALADTLRARGLEVLVHERYVDARTAAMRRLLQTAGQRVAFPPARAPSRRVTAPRARYEPRDRRPRRPGDEHRHRHRAHAARVDGHRRRAAPRARHRLDRSRSPITSSLTRSSSAPAPTPIACGRRPPSSPGSAGRSARTPCSPRSRRRPSILCPAHAPSSPTTFATNCVRPNSASGHDGCAAPATGSASARRTRSSPSPSEPAAT